MIPQGSHILIDVHNHNLTTISAYTCAQPVGSGSSTTPATGTAVQRYYYDSVAGVCDQFSYYANSATASNSNGNNFATRDHCVTYCQDS